MFSWYSFQIFLKILVTIPVAPIITGITLLLLLLFRGTLSSFILLSNWSQIESILYTFDGRN